MKGFCAILLTLIFTFNLVGYLVVFKVQQYQIRREIIHNIERGIPESQLTCITVNQENKNKIIWKHKKEFRYQGEMYDVVKVEKLDEETTVYYCINDSQETHLFAKLDKHLKKTGKNKNQQNFPLKIVFKILPKPDSRFGNLIDTVSEVNQKSNFKYAEFYTSPELEISSPPPRIV